MRGPARNSAAGEVFFVASYGWSSCFLDSSAAYIRNQFASCTQAEGRTLSAHLRPAAALTRLLSGHSTSRGLARPTDPRLLHHDDRFFLPPWRCRRT